MFCTSESAVRTQLADAIEKQRKRLARRSRPIELDVWDAEELSLKLKRQREIVRDFFGPHWARRFFGDDAPSASADVELMFEQLLECTEQRILFVSFEWAPERLRDRLAAFRENDPDAFEKLHRHLGSPPDKALVASAAANPPAWLVEASVETWDILARIAEVNAEWKAASLAWEQLAERLAHDEYAHVGALVSAAIAAEVGHDEPRHDEFLQKAASIDERHPRLILARIPEDARAAERLRILSDLSTDDPDDRAQIAAQKTLSYILTPDLEAARAALEDVERDARGSAIAAGLAISITVQEGRLAVMGQRPLDQAALTAGADDARALRDRLIREERWLESTRMLMLEADVHALLGDRTTAAKTLRRARDEERRTTEQKQVLAASAAGRALDFRLALELLEGADDTPTVRRIRLEALEETGTPPEREAALAGLDELVRQGGQESAEAAFVRLAATLGPRPTPWSDEAAVYLKQCGHERAAVTAQALYTARADGFEAAERLLRPHRKVAWAVATRLRLALSKRAPRDAATKAAEELLSIGPSQALRVEAGVGFARGGLYPRAREVLVGVARDPGAPVSVRADAYAKLIHVVGNDQSDWEFAATLHDEWVALAPRDSRAPQWAPRIANRARRRRDS